MLEIAGNLARTLVLIVMVAALLDMLIPQSHFRQYLRMVIGMLVLLMVVNALANLTGRSLNFVLPSFATEHTEYSRIQEEGRKLWEQSRELAIEQYRETLSLYIQEELKAFGDWELRKLDVLIEEDPGNPDFGRLNGARVFISPLKGDKDTGVSSPVVVDPVRIGDHELDLPVPEEDTETEDIPELVRVVAGWLGLPAGAVEVLLIK